MGKRHKPEEIIAKLRQVLVSADDGGIAFRWKDYRITGPERWKTMTLAPAEFIRRFLIHVLPKGFHRIRHYGLLANTNRAESIARARELLGAEPRVVEPEEEKAAAPDEPRVLPCPCPRCGGPMIVIEVFAWGPSRGGGTRRHPRQSRSTRHETDAPTRSQHGRSDPLVLRRQRSDLAESSRPASEMPPWDAPRVSISASLHALMRADIMFGSTFVATASPPSTPVLRSNPIAPVAPACPNPATSCLGASPTPPVGVRGRGAGSGVRETCTGPDTAANVSANRPEPSPVVPLHAARRERAITRELRAFSRCGPIL